MWRLLVYVAERGYVPKPKNQSFRAVIMMKELTSLQKLHPGPSQVHTERTCMFREMQQDTERFVQCRTLHMIIMYTLPIFVTFTFESGGDRFQS